MLRTLRRGFADFTVLELSYFRIKTYARQKYFRYKAQRAKVSKNVSVSAGQRLGLGLVSDPKLNVSVSISGKVVRSRSRSRLELEAKRLGLVSVSDLNVSFTSLVCVVSIWVDEKWCVYVYLAGWIHHVPQQTGCRSCTTPVTGWCLCTLSRYLAKIVLYFLLHLLAPCLSFVSTAVCDCGLLFVRPHIYMYLIQATLQKL